jgi:hypothetical protein
VLQHIRSRLFERKQQFVALLGLEGFFHALAKVTPLNHLWHNGRAVRQITGERFAGSLKFYGMFAWLNLRTFVRAIRGRRSSYTMHDLEGVKRGANVASYADYQHHRRDAK